MVLKGYDFAGLADAMGYGMRYVRGAVAGGQTRPAEFWKRFAEVTGATCGERADILSRPASREVFSGKFTYWGYVIVLRGEGKEYTFRNPREIYETCGEGDDEAYDLRMGAEEAIKALSKAMDAVDEVVDLQEEYEYSITHDGR